MIRPANTRDEKITLVSYLATKMGITPQELVGQMPFEVVAVTRNGVPVGAVMYINFRVSSIEMACAGEPGWLTPGNLRDLFAYPFQQLGCNTVLSMVARGNDKARRFNRKLGFREMCMIESGESKDADTILYAMTKRECAWVRKAPPKIAPVKPNSEGVHAHG